MDFSLTEEQEMLKTVARDFLVKGCPKSLVREMEEDEEGYSPELWRKMAELGWMGLPFPGRYGGADYNFVDLMVLLEEMGRALLPAPYLSTVLCGLSILDIGTEEQRLEFLPKIANGEIIMALALTEPSGRYDAASIMVHATPDKEDYLINGTKLFVADAKAANSFLCVTRTKDGLAEDTITLFVLDAGNPGITCTPLLTIAGDKQCEVVFEKVRVLKKNMLGELNEGWAQLQRTMACGAVAYCAMMLGMVQQALEMSVDYAKQRVQFGRLIGSFQAIQHYCANMVSDVHVEKDKQRQRDGKGPKDKDATWRAKGDRVVVGKDGKRHEEKEYFYGYKDQVSLNSDTELVIIVIPDHANDYDGHKLKKLVAKT